MQSLALVFPSLSSSPFYSFYLTPLSFTHERHLLQPIPPFLVLCCPSSPSSLVLPNPSHTLLPSFSLYAHPSGPLSSHPSPKFLQHCAL
ncbi:hypothetical protein CLOM_g19889 [Closterium sp. NIES-68]|nr:hypothetical protein CLOM_g19889 [Closterium sp. NIES-68]